ncbi:MAG: hypothetical protein JSS81_18110 [Acidobacteria bacterium]|nr:hypothetical protein [Acidobacteriota bacterium]
MIVCQITDFRCRRELRRIFRYLFTGCIIHENRFLGLIIPKSDFPDPFPIAVVPVFADRRVGRVFDLDLLVFAVIDKGVAIRRFGRVAGVVEIVVVRRIVVLILDDLIIRSRDRWVEFLLVTDAVCIVARRRAAALQVGAGE